MRRPQPVTAVRLRLLVVSTGEKPVPALLQSSNGSHKVTERSVDPSL